MKPASRRLFSVLAAAVQVAAVWWSVSTWWVGHQNHLFGNGQWISGKELGKFVFHTYEFLFKPFRQGWIDLAVEMGYQEILYHVPESDDRRLAVLEFEMMISPDSYLVAELHKQGQAMTAVRISDKKGMDSGFYEYDAEGRLVASNMIHAGHGLTDQYLDMRLERDGNGTWNLSCNGEQLGTYLPQDPRPGMFGFRGSGRHQGHSMVKRVKAAFAAPGQPGHLEWHDADFEVSIRRRDLAAAGILLGLLTWLLRFCRRSCIGMLVPGLPRSALAWADDFTLSFLLVLLGHTAHGNPAGLHLAAAFAGGELAFAGWVRFFAARRTAPVSGPAAPSLSKTAALLLPGCLVVMAAAQLHGKLLAHQAEDQLQWKMLRNINPAALDIRPSGLPADAFRLERPLRILPGQPFFIETSAYREQDIGLSFMLPAETTMDLAFQQQSYQTRGDPDGEQLPLQRRLLRITTRDDTSMGMATGIHKKPAPFSLVNGTVLAGQSNEVRVVSSSHGLRILFNGTETVLPDLLPLGFGLTGVMVYENHADILALEVAALPGGDPRQGRSLFWGLAAWSSWMLAGAVLLLPFVRFKPLPAVAAAGMAALPLVLYAAASLLVDPPTLAYMALARKTWFDVMLAASLLLLALPALVRMPNTGRPALLFNTAFMLGMLGVLLLAWDLLPESHPLKYRFSHAATAPGEMVEEDETTRGPWYSINKLIGSAGYVWRQQFGPKNIPLQKPEGTLRVFTLGGSQAWASGAADSFSTYEAQLEARLRAKGLPVEVLNAGVNGAGISRVRVYFEEMVLPYQPDIIVADVGLNDSAGLHICKDDRIRDQRRQVLVDQFTELADRCVSNGIKLVYVQEPISMESPHRYDRPLYDALVEVVKARGGWIVDTRPEMRLRQLDHFVWWDPAHLAPYGHTLMADLIEPALEEAVRQSL